jgi:hypothetical protein
MGFFAPLTAAVGGASGGIGFSQVLGLVTSIGGELMSGMAAQDAAAAQAAHQQRLAEQRRDENYLKQVTERDNQMVRDEDTAQKKIQAGLDTRRTQATALNLAGSRGVSGLSVDSLVRDYDMQKELYTQNANRQQELQRYSSNENVKNIAKDVYIPSPVESPSMGTTIFKGLTSGLQILTK